MKKTAKKTNETRRPTPPGDGAPSRANRRHRAVKIASPHAIFQSAQTQKPSNWTKWLLSGIPATAKNHPSPGHRSRAKKYRLNLREAQVGRSNPETSQTKSHRNRYGTNELAIPDPIRSVRSQIVLPAQQSGESHTKISPAPKPQPRSHQRIVLAIAFLNYF